MEIRPDAVVLNLQFMTFGSGKVAAALGLLTPWICRMLGIPSIVILHNIIETVKLDELRDSLVQSQQRHVEFDLPEEEEGEEIVELLENH